MMNVRLWGKPFCNSRFKAGWSICLSLLLLLSCTMPPLTQVKDSTSQVLQHQGTEKKRSLRLSQPVTALTSVIPQGFGLKGEDEVRFDLPLSLPIVRSGIKTGSGMIEFSSRSPENWNPAGLVTASATIRRLENGDIRLSFAAGTYAGATTYYSTVAGLFRVNL